MPTNSFAQKMMGDVIGGARGKLWKGQMASIIERVTKLSPLSVLINQSLVATYALYSLLTICMLI